MKMMVFHILELSFTVKVHIISIFKITMIICPFNNIKPNNTSKVNNGGNTYHKVGGSHYIEDVNDSCNLSVIYNFIICIFRVLFTSFI
jgi:hypothetical protein